MTIFKKIKWRIYIKKPYRITIKLPFYNSDYKYLKKILEKNGCIKVDNYHNHELWCNPKKIKFMKADKVIFFSDESVYELPSENFVQLMLCDICEYRDLCTKYQKYLNKKSKEGDQNER